MNLAFFRYFFVYIFKGQTRQRLIFLTIVGLFISSFSLMVLQGIMGGLQNGLIKRAKTVSGSGYFDVTGFKKERLEFLLKDLNYLGIKYSPELELELMIQTGKYLAPVILHGVDYETYVPDYLMGRSLEGVVLGGKLGREIGAFFGSKVRVTTPAHSSILMREIPRQAVIEVSDFYSSELPEIDGLHAWVRIGFLQNLIRKREVNKIRIFSNTDQLAKLWKSPSKNYSQSDYVSWEDQNSTLVWALGLETKVMLFLFTMMSFLIGICIVSGYLIFFNKVKTDLASFWILGLSRRRALNLIYSFGHLLTMIFSALGVIAGLGFLSLLDSNSLVIMPEHFVERNIPVNITSWNITVSFLVPYAIAFAFTHATFRIFKREDLSFINLIRKVG